MDYWFTLGMLSWYVPEIEALLLFVADQEPEERAYFAGQYTQGCSERGYFPILPDNPDIVN